MDKNEGGGDGSNQYKSATCTKTEQVAQDDTPTYSELGIDRKDASRLQRAAEHSEAIAVKVAEVKAKGQPVIASRVINQVLQEASSTPSTMSPGYQVVYHVINDLSQVVFRLQSSAVA